MKEERKEKIIKLMQMVMEDVKNDAADFDGKPFTGKTMGAYMGHHGAAITAIANAIKDMLIENENQ